MGSVRCLTVRNIWVKFNENRSNGSGDMERTNHMTMLCDIDLESAKPSHKSYTLFYCKEHLGEVE